MSYPFDLPAYQAELPETLRDIVTKLRSFGFTLAKKDDAWILYFPTAHWSGSVQIQFNDNDLGSGLLQVLRNEETQNDILHRYEQFDQKWGKVVYGNSKSDTSIAHAGCGPTSLAIVLHYLMSNGSRPHDACYADYIDSFGNDVTPLETARYAISIKARISGHGTAGKPMIKHIQEWWPEFDGVEVKLDEAAFLLQEGKLIIFLCKHCSGYNKAPLQGT